MFRKSFLRGTYGIGVSPAVKGSGTDNACPLTVLGTNGDTVPLRKRMREHHNEQERNRTTLRGRNQQLAANGNHGTGLRSSTGAESFPCRGHCSIGKGHRIVQATARSGLQWQRYGTPARYISVTEYRRGITRSTFQRKKWSSCFGATKSTAQT